MDARETAAAAGWTRQRMKLRRCRSVHKGAEMSTAIREASAVSLSKRRQKSKHLLAIRLLVSVNLLYAVIFLKFAGMPGSGGPVHANVASGLTGWCLRWYSGLRSGYSKRFTTGQSGRPENGCHPRDNHFPSRYGPFVRGHTFGSTDKPRSGFLGAGPVLTRQAG